MPSANHLTKYLDVWRDIQKELWKVVIDGVQPHNFIYAELKKHIDRTKYLEKTGMLHVPTNTTKALSAYRACCWLAQSEDNYAAFVQSFLTVGRVMRNLGFEPADTIFHYTFDEHRWKAEALGMNPFRILDVNFYYMKAEPSVWEAIFKYIISSASSAKYVAENYVRSADAQQLLAVYTDISPLRIHDVYCLSLLFDQINEEYFAGTIAKPLIAWTSRANYRRLGSYNFSLNVILISRILNDRRVPEFAVKFVLYHEMLHIYHGYKTVNGCHYAHTPEFRRDEQKFEQYAEAEKALQCVRKLVSK